MNYEILIKIAKKAEVSLPKFYNETFTSYKLIEKMKKDNYVPSYIKIMLWLFVKKKFNFFFMQKI